jgi:hypothetical protein
MALEVESSAWDGLLSSVGSTDVYYSRGYLEAAAAAEPGRCAYLYLRDPGGAVVFPCVVRELPELKIRDVTTVAYGGPLGLGPSPPVEQFSSLYEDWCAEQEIVTTFVRFHPLFANHRYAPSSLRRERVKDSVKWALEGDLFAGLHRHHRRLSRRRRLAARIQAPLHLIVIARAVVREGVHDVQRYRDLTGSTEVDYDGFCPAYRCELSETAPVSELPSPGSTA